MSIDKTNKETREYMSYDEFRNRNRYEDVAPPTTHVSEIDGLTYYRFLVGTKFGNFDELNKNIVPKFNKVITKAKEIAIKNGISVKKYNYFTSKVSMIGILDLLYE